MCARVKRCAGFFLSLSFNQYVLDFVSSLPTPHVRHVGLLGGKDPTRRSPILTLLLSRVSAIMIRPAHAEYIRTYRLHPDTTNVWCSASNLQNLLRRLLLVVLSPVPQAAHLVQVLQIRSLRQSLEPIARLLLEPRPRAVDVVRFRLSKGVQSCCECLLGLGCKEQTQEGTSAAANTEAFTLPGLSLSARSNDGSKHNFPLGFCIILSLLGSSLRRAW